MGISFQHMYHEVLQVIEHGCDGVIWLQKKTRILSVITLKLISKRRPTLVHCIICQE